MQKTSPRNVHNILQIATVTAVSGRRENIGVLWSMRVY
jgi:hypothetical protein